MCNLFSFLFDSLIKSLIIYLLLSSVSITVRNLIILFYGSSLTFMSLIYALLRFFGISSRCISLNLLRFTMLVGGFSFISLLRVGVEYELIIVPSFIFISFRKMGIQGFRILQIWQNRTFSSQISNFFIWTSDFCQNWRAHL